MVDAYTFQTGTESKSFKSRAELFDYMIEKGEYFIDGEIASKMKAHCQKRVEKHTASKASNKDEKVALFQKALDTMDEHLVE
jgi:hypothetical protein